MALISVYYYHSRPHLLTIDFKPGEIKWRKMFVFVALHHPFVRRSMVEYEETVGAAEIQIRQLGKYDSYPGSFAVKLRPVKLKYENYQSINRFIIRISDLQSLFGPGYDLQKVYSWENGRSLHRKERDDVRTTLYIQVSADEQAKAGFGYM